MAKKMMVEQARELLAEIIDGEKCAKRRGILLSVRAWLLYSVPHPVERLDDMTLCPACECDIGPYENDILSGLADGDGPRNYEFRYCPSCGQKIIWR